MNPHRRHERRRAARRADGEGGIQVCGNAENCVKVCPKGFPLTTAIGRVGRAATLHSLKKLFDW